MYLKRNKRLENGKNLPYTNKTITTISSEDGKRK